MNYCVADKLLQLAAKLNPENRVEKRPIKKGARLPFLSRRANARLGYLQWHRVGGVAHAVIFIEINQARFEVDQFGIGIICVGTNDDDIADISFMRGSTVD